ncbi:TPA: hypothetical protein ACH3X3_005959 [Trebouxia sp. C0006]
MTQNSLFLLCIGGAAGAAAACAALHVMQRRLWNSRSRQYDQAIHPQESSLSPVVVPKSGTGLHNFHEDEILAEQFTRNVQFFGQQGQIKVANAFVVVIGLGGVGSHAAHMLLRSGVGKLRLVDFDQVSVSSLNRHAVATRQDVGMSKAQCLKDHFLKILPEAEVEAINAMYTEAAEDQLLGGKPDFVMDAIDNIDTKVALLAACHRRGIPVLSSAGAGSRADPTRLRIADIAECSSDKLSRSVRHRLRREHNITRGIQVVLSLEKPRVKLLHIDNPSDYQIVPGFRVGIVPVLGTMPSIFGMAAASHILCQLAEQPFNPEPIMEITVPQYETQVSRLLEREETRFGNTDGVTVDYDDVVYVVRDVWRGVSAHALGVQEPGLQRGFNRSTARLVLTRWDASKPAGVDNLVLMTFEQADQHDEGGAAAHQHTTDAYSSYVRQRLELVRTEYGFT